MHLKLIAKYQKKIIFKLKKIIQVNKTLNKEFSLYDYFYFTNWAKNYGAHQVNRKIKSKNFFYNLKNLMFLAYAFSLRDLMKYHVESRIEEKKYKNLIISYSNNIEIGKKLYFDKIFNTSNNLRSTLWLIINFDFYNSKIKIPNNCIIINKIELSKFLYFFSFFSFFKNFLLVFLNIKNLYDKNFYKILDETIKKILTNNNLKKVFMAYESQPHQHFLVKSIKNFKKEINIIGYMHSCLPSLPIDFFFKNYEPDLLLTNGIQQKNILIKFFGWKKNQVKAISSFRYRLNDKKKFQNKIFLPYFLEDPKKYSALFKLLFSLKNRKFYPSFELKNHPLMTNSHNHKKLIKDLIKIQNNIIIKNKNNLFNNKVSIVFGVSSSIMEILEHGIEVINICQDEMIESNSNIIWNNVNVERLEKNIFKYSLKQKGFLIKFGKKNEFRFKYET